jgi:hypothetical protein
MVLNNRPAKFLCKIHWHKYNMVCEFEEENQTDLQNSCARYIGNNAYISVFADGDNWGEDGH